MNFLFLLLVVLNGQARDLFEISKNSFFNQTESETKLRTGAPPISISEDIRWINSVSYTHHQIDHLSFEENEELKLKELVWSPLLIFKGTQNWKVSWGLMVAHRSEGEEFNMNTKTFSMSQFINWSPQVQKISGWNWSWGIFIPDRSLQSPVYPGVSFSYLSEDKKWNWQFRGPTIHTTFDINDHYQWISKFYFRSGSYRVNQDGFLSNRGSYVQVRQTRIETGLKTTRLKPWMFSFHIGYQLRGNVQVVNSQGEDPDNLSERAASYLDLVLSYALF